jgi:hypothetical protein
MIDEVEISLERTEVDGKDALSMSAMVEGEPWGLYFPEPYGTDAVVIWRWLSKFFSDLSAIQRGAQ